MTSVEVQTKDVARNDARVELTPQQEAIIDSFADAVPAIAGRVIKGAVNYREAHEFAVSDGYYGLLRAAINFDPSKAASDATSHSVYLERYVTGEIINGMRIRLGRETKTDEKTKRIIEDKIVNKKPSVINDTATSLDLPRDHDDDAEFDRRLLGLGDDDSFVDDIALKDLVKRGLEGLKPEHKTIFGMYYLMGMSQHEIAAEVGFSQMHVSRIIRRVLANIQKEAGISKELSKSVPDKIEK